MNDAFDVQVMSTEADAIRTETRSVLQADSWRWLAIWSVVCLGAGISSVGPWSDQVAPWYWMVGAPLGMIGTAVVGHRYERSKGVRTRGWPYWAIGSVMAAAITGAGWWMSDEAHVIWLWVVLGSGFALMSALDQNRVGRTVLLAGVGLTVTASMLVDDAFAVYSLAGFGFSLMLAWLAVDGRGRVGRR